MKATHVLGGREPLSFFEGRRSRLVASRISPVGRGELIRLVVPRRLARLRRPEKREAHLLAQGCCFSFVVIPSSLK